MKSKLIVLMFGLLFVLSTCAIGDNESGEGRESSEGMGGGVILPNKPGPICSMGCMTMLSMV